MDHLHSTYFLQLSQTKKAKVESDLEALKEQIKRDIPLVVRETPNNKKMTPNTEHRKIKK